MIMITQKEMDEIFIATLKSISQVCDITTPGNVAHNLPTIKCKCRDMLSFYKNNTITPWYSVAEGDLPPNNKNILCQNDIELFVGYFSVTDNCFYDTISDEEVTDVKYWMEIPQIKK